MSTPRWAQLVVRGLNGISRLTGQAVAWLTLLMVVFTFLVVLWRYAFPDESVWQLGSWLRLDNSELLIGNIHFSSVRLQESIIYLHGLVFLLGAAYTLQQDEHVRVDIFYRHFTDKGRARVDLIGFLVLLTPVCLFILWQSWGYVAFSWRIAESSAETGGLPGLYLLKSTLLLMPVLLLIQGLALALQQLLFLLGKAPSPYQAHQGEEAHV